MALGTLLRTGARYASPISRALSKAIDPVKKLDARLIDRVNKRFVTKTPEIVGRQSASIREKVKALDAAHAANYDEAKAIVRIGQTSLAGAAGLTIGNLTKKDKNGSSSKPSTTSTTSKPKPKPKSKPVQSFVSRPSVTESKPKPKTASASKPKTKMTSIRKNTSRFGFTEGKIQVPVGSSIIRNKDGSIKKVKKPSGKKPTSRFARMSKAQIAKLGRTEKRAYKKYLESKGK